MIDQLNFFITNYGLIAIFVLMLTNGLFSGPPSEITLALSGILASTQKYEFIHVFLAALFGNLLGAYILYSIARLMGDAWLFKLKRNLEKRAKFWWLSKAIPNENTYAFLSNKFKENNIWVCVFRCFPVVRSVISFPAGVVKMNQYLFLIYSSLGMALWALIWQGLGFYTIWGWSQYQWYISIPLFLIFIGLMFSIKSSINRFLQSDAI